MQAKSMPRPAAVETGNWVFLSGVRGNSRENATEDPGFRAQARFVMNRLIALAAEHGMSRRRFVKCNVMLRDMSFFDDFAEICRDAFQSEPPVITVIEVPALPGGCLIMVDAFGLKDVSALKCEPVVVRQMPPAALGPHAMKAGELIFTSALVPAGREDGLPVEDYDEQIRTAIGYCLETVEAAGASSCDVIKGMIYLKDMTRFDDFNKVYGEYFCRGNHPAARSCFGVTGVTGPYALSVELIACTGKVTRLRSQDAPIFNLPFCQGVKADDLIFVSGQVGYDQHTKTVPETFVGQARQMMKNMLTVAGTGGAKAESFVKTWGFLTDPQQKTAFDLLYAEALGERLPADTTITVNGLAYRYVVEIDGIACVEDEEEQP